MILVEETKVKHWAQVPLTSGRVRSLSMNKILGSHLQDQFQNKLYASSEL